MHLTSAVRSSNVGCAVVFMALLGSSAAWAQGSAPPAPAPPQLAVQPSGPAGSVSGTVFVQDTQRPARFADVTLQAVAPVSDQNEGRVGPGFGGGLQARTDVDGVFLINGVAPGDYYVLAAAPGSIREESLLRAAVAAGVDPADLLARIPMVHVVADSTSSVNVSLQRGGTLSGRLTWEDGSPAAGIPVVAQSTAPTVRLPDSLRAIRSPGNNFNSTSTDDRGVFRITGLVSGDYVLMAMLQSRSQYGEFGRSQQTITTLDVYAPGVFHKASAKPVTVRVGEERDDASMTIDLRGLHTVSGHATSASGGATVASGRISLIDPTDPNLQLYGSIQADGSFSVHYVPPGSYTLQIAGASTQAGGGFGGRSGRGSTSGGTSFRPFSAAVTVTDGDLTGVAVTLTPVQNTQ